MPSPVTGHKFGSEQFIPGFMSPAMWSYGVMPPPWHQTVPAQPFAYPMPFPYVMPQLNAQQHQWLTQTPTTPMENFTSLPPKANKRDIETPPIVETPKPTRRYSDPGPVAAHHVITNKKQSDGHKMWSSSSPVEEDFEYSESQLFAEEASKDKLFSSLLQELRAARNLNRQLLLDLHKAKMQLQVLQQQPNDHQPPGSVAALVQKLFEAHHIRSDILANWNNQPNKSEDSFGRRSSYTSSRFESDEHESSLLKQREMLINRLQATEKRIQHFRNTQWNGGAGNSQYYGHPADMRPSSAVHSRSAADGILSSSKVSRRHSFSMTSPSSSDPASLDDIELPSAKQHGGTMGGSGVLSNLLLQPVRPHLDGRGYSSSSSNATAAVGAHPPGLVSTAIGEAALKRDLEQQLATVERDRRQLEHQLVETIGGRAHSEDRIIKLERLVTVLRKKLEMQTSMSFTGLGANGSATQPSPSSESSGTATGNTSAASTNEYATAAYPLYMGKSQSPSVTDGPSSLPSYLQVVGPITQL